MLTEREILTVKEALQINPVTLAFVGDTVYSLYVRERLALSGCGKVGQLQKVAAQVVSAKGQSEFLDKVLPMFTEEEADVFRRAKNAKKATKSKSATSLEYSRSTGFEAVLGYLYLTGREERIKELLSASDGAAFEIKENVTVFKPIRR
ncbi:MAG: Mini-ribonuclease 3 [Clostridiales bacterium]|nr:Mini-ribonuclease 3 [Clostridiales bacterium]